MWMSADTESYYLSVIMVNVTARLRLALPKQSSSEAVRRQSSDPESEVRVGQVGQLEPGCVGGGFGTVGDTQLPQNSADVVAHGAFTQVKRQGDFSIGIAGGKP